MAANLYVSAAHLVSPPALGTAELIVLSPTLLELTFINSTPPRSSPLTNWDWVDKDSRLKAPGLEQFVVKSGKTTVAVEKVGFRRRVVYAPLRQRDLRIGNYLYLELSQPIGEGQTVEVTNPSGQLWAESVRFTAQADPWRWNPAIHVNQVGYLPAFPKRAMIGYYLGSLGEMPIPNAAGFKLVAVPSGQEVFSGALVARRDSGYSFPTYQQVWEAEFSAFTTPGQYRLVVPGLGASFPFLIEDGVAAAFARTYALGLYHQRCGMANELPFTRFTHGPCHLAPADIPTMAFQRTQDVLASMSSDFAGDPLHTAPQLKNVASSLCPFVKTGKVDVTGGHHDAGDYSKYTINSAALIHYLVFAADALPGVGELDNLGIPESGDGKSDLLQEAKWEADFLARLQDVDGAFYFLVYPRDRNYEDNVLPDRGDPQVLFPKTTAVTAAAVAALAQTASSPRFKQQFPDAAKMYLSKARLGWDFLQRAVARYGRVGSYQKISHYGDTFQHQDELAWAAAELFLATGEAVYHQDLLEHYNPADPGTRRWGWWRLFEGYGCAARSYAFAVRTGRLTQGQLDGEYLTKCQAEVRAGAQDQLRFARANAYGTSFALEDKRFKNGGWYFPIDRAFDLAVGYQLEPRPEFLDALLSNLNYEGGCNPVNVSYLSGLGWKRPSEMVDQYALNDRRMLPPSGKPWGSIQVAFGYLNNYKEMLGLLSFPPDNDLNRPYPVYDRWGDSFNLSTEFIAVNQARSLASLAWLMAQTPLKDQPWSSVRGQIRIAIGDLPQKAAVTAQLDLPGKQLDLSRAQIIWEAPEQPPAIASQLTFIPTSVGPQWVEAEAQWPDGRRVFAATNFVASIAAQNTNISNFKTEPRPVSKDTVALYHLDGNISNAAKDPRDLTIKGKAIFDSSNLTWMKTPHGKALRVLGLGDGIKVELPADARFENGTTTEISVEVMLYVRAFRGYGITNATIVSLFKGWNACLELVQDRWAQAPFIRGSTQTLVDATTMGKLLSLDQWHRLRLVLNRDGYRVELNDKETRRQASNDLTNWDRPGVVTVEVGNFDGWVDEVVIKNLKR